MKSSKSHDLDISLAKLKQIEVSQFPSKEEIKKQVLLKRRVEQNNYMSLPGYLKRKIVLLNNKVIFSKTTEFSDITCPICMEIFVRSTVTSCGHSYCESCLFESLLRKPVCPICRSYIRSQQFLFNHCLDDQIEERMKNCLNDHLKSTFITRKKENEEWNKSRKIISFEEGSEIDILDTEYVWCKGRIKEVINKKKNPQVLVHYEGWNKMYDEYIVQNSYRLAPVGFFTNRKDIPCYKRQGQMINYLAIDNQQSNQLNIIIEDEEEGPQPINANINTNNSQTTLSQIFQIVNILMSQRRQLQQNDVQNNNLHQQMQQSLQIDSNEDVDVDDQNDFNNIFVITEENDQQEHSNNQQEEPSI